MIRQTLIALLAAVLAQPALAHQGRHERHAGRLAEELQLSDAQKTSVSAILKEQHEKLRAVFKSEGDRPAKHEQLKALHDETRERLKAELTPEQLKRFDAMHDKKEWKDRSHGPLDDQARTELGLNEEQSRAVDQIFADHAKKRQELHSSDASREERHKQKEILRAETHQRLTQVLSEEQMRRFEKRMEERKMRHGHVDDADGAPAGEAAEKK